MDIVGSNHDWAWEQFSGAGFGNSQREARAILMLRRAMERPAGRLTDVFLVPKELQGAYDFVEGAVPAQKMSLALGAAAIRTVANERRAFVIVDGTSLSVTDRTGRKGFGSIGARGLPTRGLKVIDGLVVSEAGIPAGLAHLQWWVRTNKSAKSRAIRRRRQLTEVSHWVQTIETVSSRFGEHAPACSPCFVIDREGDCAALLSAVSQPGRSFIVRAAQNRPVLVGARRRKLWTTVGRQPVIATRCIKVPAAPGRRARQAVFELRTARLTIDLPERQTGGRFQLEVNVVCARERRAPHGEKRLEWVLLTNLDVSCPKAAARILDGYCLRWRVEDFHKAWKTGLCNVEDTQLRQAEHVMRWATILAAVATRAEQLKHLARETPDLPASKALTKTEIEGLIAWKQRYRKRTETIPDTMPTIGTAVTWIAHMGGFTGKSSGGPPGTITIGRGLQHLVVWAEAYCCGRREK